MKEEVEIIPINFDSFRTKSHVKVGSGGIKVRYIPTEKGFHQIIGKIKEILKEKHLSFNKVYFRVCNYSRRESILKYGSDRADHIHKRPFDNTEWELYPFRFLEDYFWTNKKGQLLAYKNGPPLSKSTAKNTKEFAESGGYRNVYGTKEPDKHVYQYYKSILKKYKYLEKDKTSKYHSLYIKLKQVEKEFPKGEKGIQPEFFLAEKIAMKKQKLMRDDVTYASKSDSTMNLDFLLTDIIKKRVSEKKACLIIYKDLYPIQDRKTKGGFDSTALYGFKKDRKKCIVSLIVLNPIISKTHKKELRWQETQLMQKILNKR
jgi:hypothetical protein